jgi:hypothetical protein
VRQLRALVLIGMRLRHMTATPALPRGPPLQQISMRNDEQCKVLCRIEALTAKQAKAFSDKIADDYKVNMCGAAKGLGPSGGAATGHAAHSSAAYGSCGVAGQGERGLRSWTAWRAGAAGCSGQCHVSSSPGPPEVTPLNLSPLSSEPQDPGQSSGCHGKDPQG